MTNQSPEPKRTIICDKRKEGQRRRYLRYKLAHPERIILHYVKQRAKRDNIPLDIDAVDIKIPEVCPVLGIPLKFNWTGERSGYFPDSPSIDRIDNNKGYIKGNVRVISNRANMLKKDMTLTECQKILADLESIYCEL